MDTLKVAVLSKSNADGGGASRVAEDLVSMLNKTDDVQAHHWMGYPGRDGQISWRLRGGKILSKVCLGATLASRIVGLPDFLTPEMFIFWNRKPVDYDIYHFHDISSAISPMAMRWLSKRRPVTWTFHDCSPFTGGCLYPMDCAAFTHQCNHCPQLRDWPLCTTIDRTGWMQRYKKQTFHTTSLKPIAPSNWMADMAVKSGVVRARPQLIPYAVDLSIFKMHDKKIVRQLLGLPEDRFLVLLSSLNLRDKRKGMVYAIEALKALGIYYDVIAVGQSGDFLSHALPGINIHAPGYISDKRMLSMYYAAANVYLFPSIADNLPNSILECLACGTPTIAFNLGGIPDMVEHNVTGWLAEPKSVAGMVEGLHISYNRPELLQVWSEAGRRKAVNTFSPEQFVQKHLNLYHQILEQDKTHKII